jgi:tetratricopeptide (TPR) repeat protein
MLFDWLSAKEATTVGAGLADDFVVESARADGAEAHQLRKFLQRVDRKAHLLSLNVLKRARLANSFKWRLLEKGVTKELVEELTHALVLRLTAPREGSSPSERLVSATANRPVSGTLDALMRRAAEEVARGAHTEAVESYREALTVDPRNAMAHNHLGVSLGQLGRYTEALQHFRQAVGIKESYVDAQFNLGTLLRALGWFADSEQPLRRALKLKPRFTDARISLAATLFNLGRLCEARKLLETALEADPRHVEALLTMGDVLAREGRFVEAQSWFERALAVDPNVSHGWAGVAALRRMTAADSAWLKGAQQCADSGLPPLNEANVRYSIGKYYDEVGEFAHAFRSYQRANELVKIAAEVYDRDARTRFVDDMVRTYPRELLAAPAPGSSDSELPVFVVGMPRSGTTLVTRIIAAHPGAKSAGELEFWTHALHRNMTALRQGPPGEAARRKLAEKFLQALRARVLTERCADAVRIVDKSPFNSDYLGVIRTVFPRGRAIYVERDPIDTCLSCYFQDFPASLNFTLDLGDLAHYYREHRRLMAHWYSALPTEMLLRVPYAGLISDQEGWTHRIVEFLGLPWDERCLRYENIASSVLSASYWQVRQKIYQHSIGRWRNYEKFIGPLRELRDSDG